MVDVGEGKVLEITARIVTERVTQDENLPTESRYMLRSVRKDVEISCPSHEVEKFPTLLDIDNILRRNCWRRKPWCQPSSAFVLWRDEGSSDFSSGIIKAEPGRDGAWYQQALAAHRHIFRGGITTIFPVGAESPHIVTCSLIDLPKCQNPCSENKGPLASDHRFAGDFSRSLCGSNGRLHIAGLSGGSFRKQLQLPFAGIPQLVGGSLQGESKNGNRDGRQRGNDPTRLVKNLGNLNSDEWNDLIRGAVFLFGLFGYFAYFVVTRDDRNKQNDQGHANTEPK